MTPPRDSQRGAAIITALLVVVLAATIAASLLSQQARALSRVERTVERVQIAAYATTTIDWARAVLYEQQKRSTYVALSQDWAKGITSTPVEGMLASGLMNDAQARFNLNNLIDSSTGRASEADVAVLKRLLTNLKLDPGLADAITDWIDNDDQARQQGGAESAYYWSQSEPVRAANRPLAVVEEIARVRGITPTTMRRLSPYLTVLPITSNARSKINLNTASRELLAAVFPEASGETIDEVIRLRETPMPYLSNTDLTKQFPQLPTALAEQFTTVTSRYFLLSTALTGNVVQSRQTALLELTAAPGTNQAAAKWPAIIWVKES